MILGGKWCRIAKFINGRNENAVKNRFFLLFQNKHNNILAKSDLLKLAHRHK